MIPLCFHGHPPFDEQDKIQEIRVVHTYRQTRGMMMMMMMMMMMRMMNGDDELPLTKARQWKEFLGLCPSS